VERVDLTEVTAEQIAKLLPAKQLLLKLALQGGGQVRLGGRLHGWLVKRLGDHRKLAHSVEYTRRPLLHQQGVVCLSAPHFAGRPGSGQKCDRAASADATLYIQGMQNRGKMSIAQRQGRSALCGCRRAQGVLLHERIHQLRLKQVHGERIVRERHQRDSGV
jgi:hypothetical protein